MNKLKNILGYIKNGDLKYHFYNQKLKKLNCQRCFTNNYEFIDRKKNTNELILILAGFQPYYWDVLLENIYHANNADKNDVCICIPRGGGINHLYDIAEKYGWSVLYISLDKLALVQNVAIKLHPTAKRIWKFDEDIVIDSSYFERMRNGFEVAKKSKYEAQIIVPMININLATQFDFLETLNLLHKYEDIHGIYKIGLNYMWNSSESAEFFTRIIENNFNQISNQIYNKNKNQIKPLAVRYSIGACYFTREYWENMGYFLVGEIGEMGLEETQVCGFSVNQWVPIICSLESFAGHLGYFKQKERCKSIFMSNPKGFKTK